jgi:y4mF family transcriptional regulator
MNKLLPSGNSAGVPVKSTDELGLLIRAARKAQALTQMDVAGLGNTGNRVIVDIENGKPTVQLKKVMDLMDLLGLQLVVRKKGER